MKYIVVLGLLYDRGGPPYEWKKYPVGISVEQPIFTVHYSLRPIEVASLELKAVTKMRREIDPADLDYHVYTFVYQWWECTCESGQCRCEGLYQHI